MRRIQNHLDVFFIKGKMRTMKNQKKRLVVTTQTSDKPYIVRNAAGEEFLLPTYPETFRALMDDKELIRDFLNSIL